MENEIFNTLLPTTDHNHVVFNAVTSHIFSSPFIHPSIIDHNSHGQIMIGNPLFSTVQEDALNNLYITNHSVVASGETPTSRTMLHVGNPSVEGAVGNTDLRENLTGSSLSATSLAKLLSSTTGFQENLFSFNISSSSGLTSDARAFMSSNGYNSSSSSHLPLGNCGYGDQDGACYDESLVFQVPSDRAISTVRPSYNVIGSSQPVWNLSNCTLKSDNSDSYCVPRNELSLSLGSCQPSIIDMPDIPDQGSKIRWSNVTQLTPKDSSSCVHHSWQDEGAFCNSEELSLYCGPSRPVHFSHVFLQSRYLHVAQQILAEIASYALENSDVLDDSLSGFKGEARMSFSSSCSSTRGFPIVGSDEYSPSSGVTKSQEDMDRPLGRQESKDEKTKLLSMLQMIDNRYNQCLDQIQNVISAFHNAANSGIPQMHARFANRTISAVYKSLRERITSQILLSGQQRGRECLREKTFESSFIQKQWALQQLERNDQQSWRPQRGLPERSVSVLRSWMFQNFLHPYPKDTDKHLLAIQSGLTRSQVSNWFINARVRLWKPMIEEMHSEITKKHQTEQGEERRGNISNQRMRMS